MSVASPCTGVCLLSSAKICQGCFRSVGEIAAWSSMSSKKRLEAVENAKSRRAASEGVVSGVASPIPAAFGAMPNELCTPK